MSNKDLKIGIVDMPWQSNGLGFQQKCFKFIVIQKELI